VRTFLSELDCGQRRTLAMMVVVVAGLHVVGFLLLFGLAAPALTVGIGVTAYTLGLRHAFDADHIAAIDNTTRKLMGEGKRPLSVGFWFSLGHSTIVFGLTFLISIGVRVLDAPIRHANSGPHRVASTIGTIISGSFLYLIAALNIVILLGIVKVFREMQTGRFDERELERQLDSRGLMNRFLGRLAKKISKPGHMYPIGLLFGLGFDTASEVALLVLAGGAAGAGLPWYAILCLPMLFAAGMSLMDSIDGTFMNFAYGWAFSRPVRKLFYNLAITGLSVAVALVIGTIELGGLLGLDRVNISLMGYILVAMFAVTWAIAALVWRVGRFEER
jgi:high-affinity nickel-transport protein